ncbi:MAG: aldolase/citrate lyase family protein [Gammaproteobacteria bacterium]
MQNNFRSKLLNGDPLIGTLITLPSTEVAEIMVAAGFDWLFIDGEHSPMGPDRILAMLQAIGDRAAAIVRVPGNDEIIIKKILDLGPDGIIIPQVNSVEQAQAAVRAAKYPPQGNRGIGSGRASCYGFEQQDYLATANEKVSVIIQAEHVDAVENIKDIVQVQGIDAVFIGPYDLSASLGVTGQVDHPEVVAAIKQVTEVCQAVDMRLGIFGVSSDAVKPYIEQGHTLVCAGLDVLLLGHAGECLRKELSNLV